MAGFMVGCEHFRLEYKVELEESLIRWLERDNAKAVIMMQNCVSLGRPAVVTIR